MASFLHQAGFSYTLLDEEHFHYAGQENLYGYYLTEDQGLPLSIFPIDKKLRYLIPFRSLAEIDNYFQTIEQLGGQVAIIGDDGEKFGMWPGTNQWVYERGWLKSFLQYLDTNKIEMMSFSSFMAENEPLGRVYLPPASYEEMMEWVLPPARQAEFIRLKASLPAESRIFLRGGQFRDFDLKYPESHHLRCRAIQVSTEVYKYDSPEARKDLYQAECNDAYWHGVFGGLYLPHLRRAVSSKLISAELKLPFRSGWEKTDLDLDGSDEYELKTPAFFIWVKPSTGGSIVEIDDRFNAINLTDVLTRRQEFYHLYSTSGGRPARLSQFMKLIGFFHLKLRNGCPLINISVIPVWIELSLRISPEKAMNKAISRKLEILSVENIRPIWKKIVWFWKEKKRST